MNKNTLSSDRMGSDSSTFPSRCDWDALGLLRLKTEPKVLRFKASSGDSNAIPPGPINKWARPDAGDLPIT